MKPIAIVKNLPANVSKFAWITARLCEGELWFYGAWSTEADARKQAQEIGGVAVRVEA